MKKSANIYSILLILFAAVFATACSKVDKTYLQPQKDLAVFSGSVYEYLKAQPSGVYDSMLLVLDRVPDVIDSLKNKPVTLFILANRSFQLALSALNANRPELPPLSLSTINAKVLDTFICRYIIRDVYESKDLLRSSDGFTLPTIKYNHGMNLQYSFTSASGLVNGGARAIRFSDTKTSPFVALWVRTTAITVDIKASNGVINVLSPGHSFGFGQEFTEKASLY